MTTNVPQVSLAKVPQITSAQRTPKRKRIEQQLDSARLGYSLARCVLRHAPLPRALVGILLEYYAPDREAVTSLRTANVKRLKKFDSTLGYPGEGPCTCVWQGATPQEQENVGEVCRFNISCQFAGHYHKKAKTQAERRIAEKKKKENGKKEKAKKAPLVACWYITPQGCGIPTHHHPITQSEIHLCSDYEVPDLVLPMDDETVNNSEMSTHFGGGAFTKPKDTFLDYFVDADDDGGEQKHPVSASTAPSAPPLSPVRPVPSAPPAPTPSPFNPSAASPAASDASDDDDTMPSLESDADDENPSSGAPSSQESDISCDIPPPPPPQAPAVVVAPLQEQSVKVYLNASTLENPRHESTHYINHIAYWLLRFIGTEAKHFAHQNLPSLMAERLEHVSSATEKTIHWGFPGHKWLFKRIEQKKDVTLLTPFYPHVVEHPVYVTILHDSLKDDKLSSINAVRANDTEISPYLGTYVQHFLDAHPSKALMTSPMVKAFTCMAICNQMVIRSLYHGASAPTGRTPLSNSSGRSVPLSQNVLFSC